MSPRLKPCRIDELKGDTIVCACGYHYRENFSKDYGNKALIDRLLDRYNEHRAARKQAGKDEE